MKDLGDKEASFLPPLEKGAREKSLQPNTRSCGGDHPPIEIQATLPDSEGSFLPLEQGVKENWGGGELIASGVISQGPRLLGPEATAREQSS